MPDSSTSTLARGVFSPDILPIISSHFPLYTLTSSLLALALTNRRLKQIIIPRLLYQRVWLQGEKSALGVLSMLKTQAGAIGEHKLQEGDEVPLGQHIHRLCVASELSKEARETNADVLRQLHALIDAGGLCNLVSLVVHMSYGWYMDEDDGYKEIQGFGQLGHSFLSSLKKRCPRITEISITGASERHDDPWLEDGLLNYQQLKVFRFEYSRSGVDLEDTTSFAPRLPKLLDNLTTFSPYLHTLALHLFAEEIDVTDDHGLFTRQFPHLRSLTLHDFTVQRPEIAMAFWTLHPNLELLELSSVSGNWFEGFSNGLPRLRVLKAPFKEARILVPLLGHQLINLTISSSINAQVPYLLRSILPNGLALLRSLGIYQRGSRENGAEALRWHEDEQGNIIEVSQRKAARRIDAAYILSLARDAPNLEELELIGQFQPPISSIASALSTLNNLRRFYYVGEGCGRHLQSIPPEVAREFLEDAREFALGCPTLESVTAVTGIWQTKHVRAKIQRITSGGLVLSEERGVGRTIGLEDTEYPGFWV